MDIELGIRTAADVGAFACGTAAVIGAMGGIRVKTFAGLVVGCALLAGVSAATVEGTSCPAPSAPTAAVAKPHAPAP
jgi:hypothetical protein